MFLSVVQWKYQDFLGIFSYCVRKCNLVVSFDPHMMLESVDRLSKTWYECHGTVGYSA